MNFYTYQITNTATNKRYFGWTNKTPEARFQVHVRSAFRGSQTILHASMRKHGIDAFAVEQVNVFACKDDAIADEIRLIAENRTNQCRYPNGGYNMTDGGEGTVGGKRTRSQSEASLQTITEYNKSLKGKTYEEIYGDRADDEKQKRRFAHKPPTKETKRKMAQAKLNNNNGCFAVRVTYDDGSIELFPSQSKAMEALGIKTRTTLRSIASGKRWRNGKWEHYNNPYPFSIELLRVKIDDPSLLEL